MSNNEEVLSLKKKVDFYQKIIVALVIVGLLFFIYGYYIYISCNKTFNELGDFIGGISGSIWALAGILYVYIAFLGQQIQNINQQIDIEFTQSEFLKQSFENSFFNLLQNHINIIQSIDLGTGVSQTTGSDCFKIFIKKLEAKIDSSNESNDIEKIKVAFKTLLEENKNDLDHIFKSATIIMQHIELSAPLKGKYFYFNVLFSQLSNFEKVLIFYSTLLDDELKALFKKHELFYKIEKTDLISDDHQSLIINS